MPRRPANANLRRVGESGFTDSFISAVVPVKSRRSPLVSVCLVLLGVVILLCYAFFNSSLHQSSKKVAGTLSSDGHLDTILQGTVAEDAEVDISSRPECRTAVCYALPFLQEIYGEAMNHILHIGPSACGVVLKLLQKGEHEAWGLLPFDPSPPVHSVCENLIRKGSIRVADVSQPLHYRSRSFSLVLASGVVDTMTSKQLNVTLRELARVSSDGVVLLINAGATQRMLEATGEGGKPFKLLKPRSRLWWQHRFQMMGLQESEDATKKFESLTTQKFLKFNYYVFHLDSL
eukprot:c15732_g1_i1 orf=135-1004(+)